MNESENKYAHMADFYFNQPELQMYMERPTYMKNMSPYYHSQFYPINNNYDLYYPSTYMLNNQEPISTDNNMIMRQFLNDQGQVDVQKMLQTISQFADTVQQVTPVIKQINDLIKSFRA